MTSAIDDLRDAQAAAGQGSSIGDYRRRRNLRRAPSLKATPTGTRLPGSALARNVDVGMFGSTGGDFSGISSAWESSQTGYGAVSTGSLAATGQNRSNEPTWVALASSILRHGSGYPFELTTSTVAASLALLGPVLESALRTWYAKRERTARANTAGSRLHSGVGAVQWMTEFLGVSRDRALDIGGVSPATYYSWIAKPDTVVRPRTIEHLLRVTASLRLLESALGSDTALMVLTSGEPSILSNLAGEPEERSAALRAISERSEQRVTEPAASVTDASSILARLRELDALAEAEPDPRPLGLPTPLYLDGEAEAGEHGA